MRLPYGCNPVKQDRMRLWWGALESNQLSNFFAVTNLKSTGYTLRALPLSYGSKELPVRFELTTTALQEQKLCCR